MKATRPATASKRNWRPRRPPSNACAPPCASAPKSIASSCLASWPTVRPPPTSAPPRAARSSISSRLPARSKPPRWSSSP